MTKILVTGCYGFIGTNLVKWLFRNVMDIEVIGLDCCTYAAHPADLNGWLTLSTNKPNFKWVSTDLRDAGSVDGTLAMVKPDHIIHLAAESHVCRSIEGPRTFLESNVLGTYNLLEAARKLWKGAEAYHVFHHVSTDEVYGQLGPGDAPFNEHTPYAPRSPYAASKAASDLWVKAFHHTYGMNTRVTNCSNNFGPHQHAEKLIPRAIEKITSNQNMTVYGTGAQVRDWLFVDDHCAAIWTVLKDGKPGEQYCLGGGIEMTNIDMIDYVSTILRTKFGFQGGLNLDFTLDRPTDDFRYAVNTEKVETLGWFPDVSGFEKNLTSTIGWYLNRMKLQGGTP